MASSSAPANGPPLLVPQSIRLQEELRQTKEELKQTVDQIRTMQTRKRELDEKVASLKCQLDLLSQAGSVSTQYEVDTFSWSSRMTSLLSSVFGISEFRSYQKAAINATMSNLDCLLIMPTGGGKSLCFQLPALLSTGMTLVVSPLISLMEDQLQAMNQLGVPTALFNSQTQKEETKYIFDSMINPSATLKLLYVTPEKLAKSKRLMSQLEKMYRLNRFSRLVIDEVHCCSQWGHDFRPDYKFLNIMKTQYPKTPIIGLTATATPNVILDVQKILNIEGSIVFKDTFFRPNLKYEVQDCGESSSKVDDIAKMIKHRFANVSGIIYCLTIKDCEDVSEKLRGHRIKADRYHAQLEPADRSKIQQMWYKGVIHVIVATVAFGMGINKLDVRFVIHHSMSKSVENYYQETGRAGRDGKPAHCILFYKFADTFRASSLMFTEKNGVVNVYNILKYCLDRKNCRKGLLAQHFGDEWELSGCGEMCDNCENSVQGEFETINAGPLLDDIDTILDYASTKEERMTSLKLMDAWLGKGNKKLRVDTVPTPKYNRQTLETIVALLLIDGFLKEDFHFTPYSTISYIVAGSKVVLRSSGKIDQDIFYQLPLVMVNPTKAKSQQKVLQKSSTGSLNTSSSSVSDSNASNTNFKTKSTSSSSNASSGRKDGGKNSSRCSSKESSRSHRKKGKDEDDVQSNLLCTSSSSRSKSASSSSSSLSSSKSKVGNSSDKRVKSSSEKPKVLSEDEEPVKKKLKTAFTFRKKTETETDKIITSNASVRNFAVIDHEVIDID